MSTDLTLSLFLLCLSSAFCAISKAILTANGSVNSAGRRDCSRNCPKLYRPVCGNNGVTYDNECFFGVANCLIGREIEIVRNRACTANSQCLRPCARILRPVCGSNGETYPNECELNNGNCHRPSWSPVTKVRDGRCGDPQNDCPVACTFEYNPVCGTDGVTYATRCAMNAANCLKPKEERPTVANSGECLAETTGETTGETTVETTADTTTTRTSSWGR